MFCIILCTLLFLSCDRFAADASGRQKPAAIIELERTDKEIAGIAENARRTLPIFFRNLARPETGADNFCVKYPLITDDDSRMEQVWITGIYFKNGFYYGVLANTTGRGNMKKGDRISFDANLITDWMYTQDGKIMGGRSIKYLLENIPEDQRDEGQRAILQMFY